MRYSGRLPKLSSEQNNLSQSPPSQNSLTFMWPFIRTFLTVRSTLFIGSLDSTITTKVSVGLQQANCYYSLGVFLEIQPWFSPHSANKARAGSPLQHDDDFYHCRSDQFFRHNLTPGIRLFSGQIVSYLSYIILLLCSLFRFLIALHHRIKQWCRERHRLL